MLRFLEIFVEVAQWFQIMLSPLLIGVISGFIVYYNYPNQYGAAIGFFLAFSGLAIGVVWATYIWKKYGTNYFMSRIMATPELDGYRKDGTKVEEEEESDEITK